MKVTSERYGSRGIAFRFDEKPGEDIRQALKANGFRWSPSSGLWWRMRSGEWADLLHWIRHKIEPIRPDGECWKCKSPNGYFRNLGAAAPVLCDECNQKRIEAEEWERQARIAADDFDLANNRCL